MPAYGTAEQLSSERPRDWRDPAYSGQPRLSRDERDLLLAALHPMSLLDELRLAAAADPLLPLSDQQHLALALDAADQPRPARRVLACGSSWLVLHDKQGHGRGIAPRCDHRLCVSCAPDRSAELAARLRDLAAREIERGRRIWHVVLTVPDTDATPDGLQAAHQRLGRALRKLNGRGGLPWLVGGFAQCEVTFHGSSAHVHWHCLWVTEAGVELAAPYHDLVGRKKWRLTELGRDTALAWHEHTGPCGPDCERKRLSLRGGGAKGCTAGGSLYAVEIGGGLRQPTSVWSLPQALSVHLDEGGEGGWSWRALDRSGLVARQAERVPLAEARARAERWVAALYPTARPEWRAVEAVSPEALHEVGQVAKYVAKPGLARREHLAALVVWMRRRHLSRVWGCWFGQPLSEEADPSEGCAICRRHNEHIHRLAELEGYQGDELADQPAAIRELLAHLVDQHWETPVPLWHAYRRSLNEGDAGHDGDEAYYWRSVLRQALPDFARRMGLEVPPHRHREDGPGDPLELEQLQEAGTGPLEMGSGAEAPGGGPGGDAPLDRESPGPSYASTWPTALRVSW